MSSTNIPRKFTVAIVGGGIGGLAFAIALAKAGAPVDVDIYESTSGFSEVGAGIGIWPRVWDDLKMLGVEDELRKRASNVQGDGGAGAPMVYRKADQTESVVCGLSHSQLITYHRAEFLHVLEMYLPSHYRTHFGKRLLSYTDSPSKPVTLYFKDGTSAQCDLLVGADGVKSVVRQTMFQYLADSAKDNKQAEVFRRCIKATWSGVYIYRDLVPTEVIQAKHPENVCLTGPVFYVGKGTSAISYPINQGRVINCASMTYQPELRGTILDEPWVTPVSSEELLAPYIGWEPHLVTLLKAMKTPNKWAVNTVEDLPTFVSGRVAILGDAAHSMTPFLGSGAGQAIEDGIILAALLAQPEIQTRTMPTALRIYDAVRRPFAQHIQDISFKSGETVWLHSPRFQHITAEESARGNVSAEELQALHAELMDLQRWAGTTTLRGDRERAVRMLKEELGSYESARL